MKQWLRIDSLTQEGHAMKRKTHHTELKVKVAFEALKGQKRVNKPVSEFEANGSQIGTWKHQLLDALISNLSLP